MANEAPANPTYLNYSLDELKQAADSAAAAGDSDTALMLRMAHARQWAEQNPTNYDAVGYNPTSAAPKASINAQNQLVNMGIGRAMVHGVKRVGNLLGLVSDQDMAESNRLDKPLMAHPEAQTGDLIGGMALSAPLGMGAAGALGKAGSIGLRLASNPLSRGALEGAVQGGTLSDPGEGGINTLLGAGAGMILPGAGKAFSTAARGLNRTAAADYLLRKGVRLTPGLMEPRGFSNLLEASTEHLGPLAEPVEAARAQAQSDWVHAAVSEGAAPGATIPKTGDVHEMLRAASDSYTPLYDAAKGFPVYPKIMGTTGPDVPLKDAFARSVNVPGTAASSRAQALDFLNNELTTLPKKIQSDNLIELRSRIRAEARDSRLGTDAISKDKYKIYSAAEQRITDALASQLPPDALATLKVADSNYGNYKIVENAIAKSKDKAFAPHHLSQAVSDAHADPAYAKGAGGSLRDLAQAGQQVFINRAPPTGARVATLGAAGAATYAFPHAAIPLGAAQYGLTVTEGGRRLAAGLTKPQKLAQALLERGQKAAPPYALPVIRQFGQAGTVGLSIPMAQALLAGQQN